MLRFVLPALFVILLLAGCGGAGPVPTTRYELPGTPGGRLCTAQCRTAQERCTESCSIEERFCISEMQSQAIKDYDAYVREQFKARKDPELRPRDFENHSKCEEKVCRRKCQKTYEGCFVNCGGTVIEETPCRFLCF